MKILVCIKQVPSVSKVKIDPVTKNLIRDGVPSIVNPPDVNALKLALKIKSESDMVSVLTMGPPNAKDALKECIAMGADNGYLISDRALAGSDTLATSYILAKTIEKIGEFDLILCGSNSIDSDTGQVGPQIAENLGFSQITYINDAILSADEIVVKRDSLIGIEKISSKLPCLVTVSENLKNTKGENIDYSNVSDDKVTVYSANDVKFDLDRIGSSGSATIVEEILLPPEKEKGKIIDANSSDEKVDKLMSIFVEKGFI